MYNKKYIEIVTFGNFPFGGASANLLRNFALSLSQIESNIVEVIIPSGFYYGKIVNKERAGAIENVKYKYLGFLNHPRNYFGKLIDNVWAQIILFYFLTLKFIKKKLNTIILYNTSITTVFPILILKFFLNIKIYNILPEFYEKPQNLVLKLKWYNFYFSLRFFPRYFDGIVVLSTYMNNIIKKFTRNSVRILIQPNILDPRVFFEKKESFYKKGMITIGYAGTPTYKDGVLDLIKSFAKLKEKYSKIHLLIIGDITTGNTIIPYLKKIAKELGVINDITFTGLVPFNKVPRLLKSCQILALTRPKGRFAEAGFPTKLGEYFACKKPVVVTNVGDIRKYFTNGEHVIMVESENINSIVAGFESLINNAELRKNVAYAGYQWMERNLNYKNISEKLNSFICAE